MTCNVVLVSAAEQSDSVVCVCVCVCVCIHILFHIIFHYGYSILNAVLCAIQ